MYGKDSIVNDDYCRYNGLSSDVSSRVGPKAVNSLTPDGFIKLRSNHMAISHAVFGREIKFLNDVGDKGFNERLTHQEFLKRTGNVGEEPAYSVEYDKGIVVVVINDTFVPTTALAVRLAIDIVDVTIEHVESIDSDVGLKGYKDSFHIYDLRLFIADKV